LFRASPSPDIVKIKVERSPAPQRKTAEAPSFSSLNQTETPTEKSTKPDSNKHPTGIGKYR